MRLADSTFHKTSLCASKIFRPKCPVRTPESPAPEQRFSNRVANYVRYRPSYPAEMMPLLRRETGLSEASTVADIGSGTGISSKLFLEAGCSVFGVEPNMEMRTAAENLLSGYPKFHTINGKAQETGLPDQSVDLIVAAQAFHWFNLPETRQEFSRILKPKPQPKGQIALIWNVRDSDSTPFLRDYEALLLRFGTDYAKVRHEQIDTVELTRFFNGPYTTHCFPNLQWLDHPSLEGRLMSSSYAPVEGEPGHAEMIAELRRLFDLHQSANKVCIEYQTQLNLGR
ncbi:class I SAM-dependent methyltransferase [Phragmitibacter flavus]|uniref:Class I SAM-dependent methyltransferase n=2 Tax=Phragmitibacter flavus TaxID=2576071 RepID=A0A5R8KJI7_9BACT|nr:class I SAM-dependent methyltransferase [Phragmitibacter flavus]